MYFFRTFKKSTAYKVHNMGLRYIKVYSGTEVSSLLPFPNVFKFFITENTMKIVKNMFFLTITTIFPATTLFSLLQHYFPCYNTIFPATTQFSLLQHNFPCYNTIFPFTTQFSLLQHNFSCHNIETGWVKMIFPYIIYYPRTVILRKCRLLLRLCSFLIS
jgi:hypothetical protein